MSVLWPNVGESVRGFFAVDIAQNYLPDWSQDGLVTSKRVCGCRFTGMGSYPNTGRDSSDCGTDSRVCVADRQS